MSYAGTRLLIKASTLCASYNGREQHSWHNFTNSLENPLYGVPAEVASPKIAAVQNRVDMFTGLLTSNTSKSQRVVMRKPSTTRFRSKLQSPFLPSSADAPNKLIVKVS